jgi:xylose isomerase
MLIILQSGGFRTGGINFDAKTRRNSTDPEDIFLAHIGGMDAFARALLTAEAVLTQSDYLQMRRNRYASFDAGAGRDFELGNLSLEDLRQYALSRPEPVQRSGKQERFENIINEFI